VVGPADEGDAASAALDEAVGLAFRVLKGVMLVLLGLVALSGVFTVGPNEVAFVRRLGRLDPEARQPGGHLALPFLDAVLRVDLRTRKVATAAFDLRRTDQELLDGKVGSREGGLDPTRDGYLVSGDANLAHLALSARVRASASVRELLVAVDWAPLVQVLLERAVVAAAAQRTADRLLGAGKAEFAQDVQRRLQDALDGLDAGLTVEGIDLEQDLVPPQVRDAFEGVIRAAQERDRLRAEAESQAARVEGEAATEAARIESGAAAEAKRVAARAQADEAAFRAYLEQWRRDPLALRERLVATTLARALGGVEEVFLVGEGELCVRLRRDTTSRREEVEARARREMFGPGAAEGGGR
jgi:membrane protease subunit HflK